MKEEMATEGDTEEEVCIALRSAATDNLVLVPVTGNGIPPTHLHSGQVSFILHKLDRV